MIEYRKADANDAGILALMRVEFLKCAGNISTDAEVRQMTDANRDFMAHSLQNGVFHAWLAESDGKIVATSGLSVLSIPPSMRCPNGRECYISNMYTVPEFRGQGIATKLFSLTMDTARELCCTRALLNATDMGRPIYEKYGFRDLKNDMCFEIE